MSSGLSCNALIGNARGEAPRCTMHTVPGCNTHVHAHAHAHLHAHVLCAQGQHPKQRMQRLECLEPGAVVGRDLRAREEPHRQRRALQGCVCERYIGVRVV